MAFLECQYGVKVEKKSYYRRSDGYEVDNFFLVTVKLQLSNLYDLLNDPDSKLSYALAARQMLEYRSRTENLNLLRLTEVEYAISKVYCDKRQVYLPILYLLLLFIYVSTILLCNFIA
jgi:hypothetical protein